jgi:cell fate regulator YaaT (PSP1 superfamily)
MTEQASPVQDSSPPPNPLLAVRYGHLGWVGEFRHDPGLKLRWSDYVVIKTERGLEIGMPVAAGCEENCPKFVRPEQQNVYVQASGEDYLQRGAGEIVRVATADDLAEQRRLDAQAKDKLAFCEKAAAKTGLSMRMVACEHLLGGERIIFYFTAEGRVDFRVLVRELAHEYHTRIEMRQIGARDEARIVADLEICGRECCCRNFLKVLRPVNMKMAKMQKATLDPTKVSGRCGRLRCCLRYEQETYEELDAKLPDIGVSVRVARGVGVVRDRQVITQLVVLDMGEGRRLAVPLEEILEILPDRAMGEVRPSRRRTQGDAPVETEDVGDAPEPRPGDQEEDDEATVISGNGEAGEARWPARGGDGGNGRPGSRAGRVNGRGEGTRDSRADERPDNRQDRGLSASGGTGRGQSAGSPSSRAGSGPQPADRPPGKQDRSAREGGVPGRGQPGRRRRRRGRRSRRDGQPPRPDNSPPRQ